jgi:methylmalonyl-CoA/ethylmalonyl-CoA epimerase
MNELADATFHHVGVACRSIDRSRRSFQIMGYNDEGQSVIDPLQGVRIQFMTGSGPRVELLEPADDTSPLHSWTRSAPTVGYHFGYEVLDLETSMGNLLHHGARTVRVPLPAVAFNGRKVCFLATRSGFLIELIAES